MELTGLVLDTTPLRTVPRYRRLWIGRSCSGFGSSMTQVAVMYQVWQSTRSTVWSGAVGLAQAIPVIAIGLLAGSLVDRFDRRRIYLAAISGQALCSIVLAVQGFSGRVPVLAVLGIVAVQSGFAAGSGPAARTFVPALLPREQVAAGLALNRIAGQAALLGGPALAGLMLGWSGVGGCYLLDAATFLLAFYGAWGLPAIKAAPSPPGMHKVAEGLAFLVRNGSVRGALLTDLATTVLSMPVSLFPLINAERFGNNPRTLGLFLTAIAVGGVAASLLSGAFTRRARIGWVMLCGSATWGVSLVLFGLSPNRWVALGFLAIAGAADTIAVVSRSTITQLRTPNELLGRVAAAEQIVGLAGPEIGNMRGGLVAGATSGTTALVSGGAMCVAAVVVVAARTAELRRFGMAPQPPQPA